jgi:hypothetical protein
MVADMSEKLKPAAPASEEEKQLARLPIAVPPEGERGFLTTSELQRTVLPLSRRTIFEWRKKASSLQFKLAQKFCITPPAWNPRCFADNRAANTIKSQP